MRIQQFVGAFFFGVISLGLVGFNGLAFHSPKKQSYQPASKELRKRFNADKGKVRLLMLLSPT